jgi:hypothetical protein
VIDPEIEATLRRAIGRAVRHDTDGFLQAMRELSADNEYDRIGSTLVPLVYAVLTLSDPEWNPEYLAPQVSEDSGEWMNEPWPEDHLLYFLRFVATRSIPSEKPTSDVEFTKGFILGSGVLAIAYTLRNADQEWNRQLDWVEDTLEALAAKRKLSHSDGS